jgi:hypothetical protein
VKSATFRLDTSGEAYIHSIEGNIHRHVFKMPLLRAFAIEYFKLQFGALSTFPDSRDSIQEDELIITTDDSIDDMECWLTIYYHGIRDYALLFPSVTPLSLQERLGEFYREAEIAFEAGSWLSFMLMCGALYEGILHHKLQSYDTFNILISKAANNSMIDSETKRIMNIVRNYRNLIHANKHETRFVSRADAMDARIVLDKLLR